MQLWAALSTNYASAASVARCLFFSLALCVLGFAPPAAADTFTVTSRDDTDTDDTGTFRWAVDQANQNGTGSDTIVFDEDLIANAIDGVIEIALNSALEAITSELIIEGPVDTDSTEYVVSIYRDPNIGDAFVVNESLTLHNALLQSNAILFNGGTNSTGTTIDLVFEVGDNLIEDVYWFVIDSDDDNDPVEDGRLVKTGLGELALLPTTADYDGGTVLVDGVLRTDTRSLQGDI
ncbi:MAG: hypothetical protein GY944_14255 [bacterium]|nr:hypothetical protein [bacterium]